MSQQELSLVFVQADPALRSAVARAHQKIGVSSEYWSTVTSGAQAVAVVAWQLHEQGFRIVLPLVREDMSLGIDLLAYDPVLECGLCVQVKSRQTEAHTTTHLVRVTQNMQEFEPDFIYGVRLFNRSFDTKWPGLLVTVAGDTNLRNPKAANQVAFALEQSLALR
jgi:hypothetical protein